MVPPVVSGPSSSICVSFLWMTLLPYDHESLAPKALPPPNLVSDVGAIGFNMNAIVRVSCRLVISCQPDRAGHVVGIPQM